MVMRFVRMCVLLLTASWPLSVSAQQPARSQPASQQPPDPRPASRQPPPVDVGELPIDLGRIQTQLAQPRDINVDLLRPTFRTSVTERRPRWFDEMDWLEGIRGVPTPSAPAWHSEFLNMVTPPEARMYGAYTNSELLQVAATSLLQALSANTVANAIKGAVRNRKEEAARREVDEAIDQWKQDQERGAEKKN
jgi:hypothetical protein